MNAYTTWLNDPKLAVYRSSSHERYQLLEPRKYRCRGKSAATIENNNALHALRRKPEHLAEIAIQRDQNAALSPAGLVKHYVTAAAHVLLRDCPDVIPGRSQQIAPEIA